MKVGLVPLLYDEHNYGGVLQFYALQHALKSCGVETDIIFFDNEERICSNESQSFNPISNLKRIVFSILNLYNSNLLAKKTEIRNKKIDIFKKNHYSKTIDSKNVNYKEYEAIICGSDQIWNPLWARKRSFLMFVPDNVNKVIYGASLGCEEMSTQEKNVFKPAIERLQHISVREYSAKKLLDTFIENKNIQVVLDPTLLLFADEWKKLEKLPQQTGYVFTYFLGEYHDKMDYVKKFADSKGLKIVNIPCASGEKLDKNHFGDIEVPDADPSEFLGLIDTAEYVFTDSFHACVFSILFKKQFYVFSRNNSNKMYGRIDTLLKNFNLPNRRITIDTDINQITDLIFDKNELLQYNLRKKSLEYLLGGIRNENSSES